jgi:hypothetical protein
MSSPLSHVSPMVTMMSDPCKHAIYQIFYNEQTRAENDAGFLGLDNSINPRPDWREYWPIREYLLNHELSDDRFYGFLSPKFFLKTGLTSADVHKFLDGSDHDIVTFSPCFDLSVIQPNVFQQAEGCHKGIYPILIEMFQRFDPALDVEEMVTSSLSSVFCNYFVAKKAVWDVWLSHCEKIFMECEENLTDLAVKLNGPVEYFASTLPAKVFIIERVIAYLMARHQRWRVKTFNPMQLPFASSQLATFKKELLVMDSLKIAYTQSGHKEYISLYIEHRANLVNRLNAGFRRR